MRIVQSVTRSALCAIACAAYLPACGGPQPPITAPGAPQFSPTVTHREDNHAWMDPSAKGRDLLYVSLDTVHVYSYPRGTLLGSLGVYGAFLCSDRFGNVFVPDSSLGEIFVYAHGAPRPKTILYDDLPVNCSVDPTSEAVAVTGSYTGGTVIFPYSRKRGWGFGKLYPDPNMSANDFCAYDNKGDLFVDGRSTSGGFRLAELARGATTFTAIKLNQSIVAGGFMQWSDGYLSIGEFAYGYPNPAVIYRFALKGSSGTEVSTTKLSQSYAQAQFLLQRGKAIGPLAYGSVRGVGFWKFPAGGSFFKSLATTRAPTGEAISLK